MAVPNAVAGFEYHEASPRWNDRRIFEAVRRELPTRGRLLDAGCGNGSMSARFAELGFDVTGVDASATGIATARRAYPHVTFQQVDLTTERPLLATFDVAVSIEVIEHVFDPEAMMRAVVNSVVPGGRVIFSTPYYGYLKLLTIAALGRWDRHLFPLRVGGHIKLFQVADLHELCRRIGLTDVRVRGVGRMPWLWKSSLVTGRRR